MAENKSLANAPHTVILDGKEYGIGEMTIGDLEQFRAAVEDHVLEVGRKLLAKCTASDRTDVAAGMIRAAAGVRQFGPEWAAYFSSNEGEAIWAWLAMKRYTPGLQRRQVQAMLENPNNANALADTYTLVNKDIADRLEGQQKKDAGLL